MSWADRVQSWIERSFDHLVSVIDLNHTTTSEDIARWGFAILAILFGGRLLTSIAKLRNRQKQSLSLAAIFIELIQSVTLVVVIILCLGKFAEYSI